VQREKQGDRGKFKGSRGDEGPHGVPGERGSRGDKGPRGRKGEKGIEGRKERVRMDNLGRRERKEIQAHRVLRDHVDSLVHSKVVGVWLTLGGGTAPVLMSRGLV
jgi:hypothetical protein